MELTLKDIPTLETKNYLLRSVDVEDANALFEFMSDHETMKYITPTPVTSIKVVREKIASNLKNFKHSKEIPLVIVSKAKNEVIGFFRFHKLQLWHKKAEMGAILRNDFQQKGVMTEILPVILEFGFNQLDLNRIVGDIFADNMGSERLLQKFGFTQEGRLREIDFDGTRYHDTIVFSLLKAEYEVNQS